MMAARSRAEINRALIVAAARDWIGTPYVHQQSVKGAGCDCLGLVRGLWRELIGPEPEPLPPYSPDWAEAGGRETLYETACRNMARIPVRNPPAGSVVLLRWRPGLPMKHAAIVTGPGWIVHAYQRHAVSETPIPRDWEKKIAAAFDFPGVGRETR